MTAASYSSRGGSPPASLERHVRHAGGRVVGAHPGAALVHGIDRHQREVEGSGQL